MLMTEFCFSLSFTPVGGNHISIAQQLQCGPEAPDLPTRSRALGPCKWREVPVGREGSVVQERLGIQGGWGLERRLSGYEHGLLLQ